MNKIIFACLSVLITGNALHAMDVNRNEAGEQFIEAARTGNLAAIEKLLAEGVDVNYVAHSGASPLFVAATRNHTEICKLLIAHGANVNLRKSDREGSSALMSAARRGNLEICILLLKHGADVNQIDNFGHTALTEAISWNKTDICKLLIDATLKAPIDPARLIHINLTPEQRSKVITLLESLKKTQVPGSRSLQPDTRMLIAQSLSNAYKLKNMLQAQIEEGTRTRPQLRQKLLDYLGQI